MGAYKLDEICNRQGELRCSRADLARQARSTSHSNFFKSCNEETLTIRFSLRLRQEEFELEIKMLTLHSSTLTHITKSPLDHSTTQR